MQTSYTQAYTFHSIEETPPAWAELTQLGNYALTLGKGTEQGHDASNPATASADGSGSHRYRVAAAEKTTKIEIKE